MSWRGEKPAGFKGVVEDRRRRSLRPRSGSETHRLAGRLIVHLAAIVSGEAEADFERGYRINLDGTRALFEAVRLEGSPHPFARASSLPPRSQCSGRRFPPEIGD